MRCRAVAASAASDQVGSGSISYFSLSPDSPRPSSFTTCETLSAVDGTGAGGDAFSSVDGAGAGGDAFSSVDGT